MAWEKYNFSEDFADALLSCVIQLPDKFDIYGDIIDPKFFNGSAAVETVIRLKEYHEKYGTWPNFTTLANYAFQQTSRLNPDRAKEIFDYVGKVAKCDISDSDAIFDLARDFARERALYRAIKVAHVSLLEGKDVKGGLVPMFEQALMLGENKEDMGYVLQKDAHKIIEKVTSNDYGISTGFQPFNEIWRQGWSPGWLIVPLAPPKRFKTTFCINLAINMSANGDDVLYYACEISEELAGIRALCANTGQTMDDLYDSPNKFGIAVDEQMGYLVGNLLFKGFSSQGATISMIKAHAKKAIKLFGLKPKAIFIDYAETVQTEAAEKNSPDHRRQADVYTQARALGGSLGCCVIMPDRCNAETVDKAVPNMRSFQGAFQKAGIVDAGIGLCQTDAENLQNQIRYFIFLNRHGKAAKHFVGKVDPERYYLTVDKEIPYTPEEPAEPKEKRQGRRNRQTPEMRAMTKSVQDDDTHLRVTPE